jgi:hypothetical protein
MRDFRDAKVMAHALRDALKSKAVETTHSESLELIAKAFGFENWNILSAKIEATEAGAGAAPALSPAGAPDSAAQDTLYCSFCGKSQHDVKKLIAGPLVYICDECVELCSDIVRDDDPFSALLNLLAADEKSGDQRHPATFEYLRGRSTEAVTSAVERSQQVAEHYRLTLQFISRRLAMRPDEALAKDDILTSPRFAYLAAKSKQELLALRQGAQRALKRCEDALRIATMVLGEGKKGGA